RRPPRPPPSSRPAPPAPPPRRNAPGAPSGPPSAARGTAPPRRARPWLRATSSVSNRVHPRNQLLRLRLPHQPLEPLRFRHHDLPPEARQPVVATTLIPSIRRRALLQLLHHALLEEPLDRAVQRPRPQPHLPSRPLFDVPHDRVAVALSIHQREQDVEHRGRERQQVAWIPVVRRHVVLGPWFGSRRRLDYIVGRYSCLPGTVSRHGTGGRRSAAGWGGRSPSSRMPARRRSRAPPGGARPPIVRRDWTEAAGSG